MFYFKTKALVVVVVVKIQIFLHVKNVSKSKLRNRPQFILDFFSLIKNKLH